ncbi:CRE_HP_G0097040.mRNA.1.CDS.1 [Saccharomyces cerevisiae]|nr:CRE_HP_G0046930.mRNA.1.CDS.1 [Saccharomyces cerevisiae]CAI4992327.1 CRE_HP_G0067490.mRNA.1.CDS.1 [Saccharomyces cerevisiae]CAI5026291.1 CRE_HP_G0097040.mRNA.1.CDS.1 [Saccharomyces cerevisiae]CAI6705077.1 CRE_HP_G0046930.mRNA.1.CDS.1 [Saccharomyces cerevisiae]CAI6868083.1 CRE_HP_G0067490.mRNA.1.CDS.1 [Saccharomyces cerevisiae]
MEEKREIMSDEAKEKRELESQKESSHNKSEKSVEPKPKRRRRRNYDDYDAEVAKEETKAKNGLTKSENNGTVEDSESDMDDAELDALMGNEGEEEEDDLAEIDTSNIITSGRRTRGKVIDYKKTAEELDKKEPSTDSKDDVGYGEKEEDEEDEEDDDFKEQ